MKPSSYRRATPQKVTAQWRELVLVAEKHSSLPTTSRCRRKKRNRRSAAEPQAQPHPSVNQDDEMQVGEQLETNTTVKDRIENQRPLLQEQGYDQVPIAQEVELDMEARHDPEAHVDRVQAGSRQSNNDQLDETIMNEEQDHTETFEKGDHANLAARALLEPSTPHIVSGDEQSSGHNASMTSPSQKGLQSKCHDGAESNKPNEPIQTDHNSAGAERPQTMSLPHSQRSMASSNSGKTTKQTKADIEAMFELSKVSVKRRQSFGEDENDNGNQQDSDEDQNGERNQWSDSDQSFEDEDEALSDDDSSDMAVEPESDEEDLELVAVNQQPSCSGIKKQNEHERTLPRRPNGEGNTSSMHVLPSLQDVAKKALKVVDIYRESGVTIDSDPLTTLQDDVRNQRPQLLPKYNEYIDISWRPTPPVFSGLTIEVDEDIYDSPMPIRRGTSQLHPSRQRSRIPSQPLRLVRSRPISPKPIETIETQHDTQGSIILGETQNSVLPERVIYETQLLDEPVESHLQIFDALDYFARASQTLKEPIHRLKPMRAKSSPAHLHLGLDKDDMNLLPPTAMFRATISPVKSSRLSTLTEEVSTPHKSLDALTRKASQGMGTLPAGARSRTVSVPFKPPFKNVNKDAGKTEA